MRRGEEQEYDDFPPGFTPRRKRSSENRASLRNKAIHNSEDVIKSPTIKLKFSREVIISSLKRELSEKSKTQSPMLENANNAHTDKQTTRGAFNESAGTLSFNGENGEVYTLSEPPKSSDLAPEVDAPSVLCVKKGLVSFLLETSPNDIHRMITQANNIFAFLQEMNAEYMSFYNDVRVYISLCLRFYAEDQELKKCKESAPLVSQHDQLLEKSNEIKNDLIVFEDDIEKAKSYMAPLESRVVDMKELLEKLEIELDQRKIDLKNVEARKAEKMEELAALDVELKATTSDAEKTRGLIRNYTVRREIARASMEKARNQLRII